MSDFILLLLIVVLLLCLLVTLVVFLVYSGLLVDVVIKTGSPPVQNVTVAYKFKEGPYKESGAAFTEPCSIGPKQSTIAIYYDDPKQRPAEKCRYAVGSVLSEGEEKPDAELQKLYEKFGFKVISLPKVSHAVTTSFPATTPLSYILAPFRVYPRLSAYIEHSCRRYSVQNKRGTFASFDHWCNLNPSLFVLLHPPTTHRRGMMSPRKWLIASRCDVTGERSSLRQERKLSAFPTIEICASLVTNYMVPLSRQTDFFVPEMKDEVKTDVIEEDSDEDRGTDITGADSHSDVSSGSGSVPWDSRETSLAASTAASLASSLPLRDVMDAEHGDAKPTRDGSEPGSDVSLGSGSSFEELDVAQEDEEGREEKEDKNAEEEVPQAGDREDGGFLEKKKEPLGDDGKK
ncbi:testis-expressed protein 264 isoform X1 [Nerophis ophidion]|uniref:testis-expressed protein 264 isoform X1 n=1 Tax=Nerophis ophidion TaxID=159077 RepID=UPI002ADF5A70|nr:testis-expressed protein 264 isoform X1 [Nerophis ophidion]